MGGILDNEDFLLREYSVGKRFLRGRLCDTHFVGNLTSIANRSVINRERKKVWFYCSIVPVEHANQ